MQITLVVVSIALSAFLGGAGVGNIFYVEQSRKDAEHLRITSRRTRFIGWCLVAGAFGLVGGLFWRPLGIAAATGVVLLMIGAITAHRRVGDSIARWARALAVLVMAAFILAGHGAQQLAG